MKFALTLLAVTVSLAAANAPELIPGKYLVILRADASAADVRDVATTYGLTAEHTYTHVYKGFSAAADEAAVMRLRADPRVKLVEQDQVMRATPFSSLPGKPGPVRVANRTFPIDAAACVTQRSQVDWGLARICKSGPIGDGIGNTYAYDSSAASGVDAYIIDTGIFARHVDFASRASQIFKATPSWSNDDGNGHGTHVASTIGGTTWGTAKLVDNLYGVKVLGDDGSGTTAGVVAGVDYVTGLVRSNRKRSVANLSLGGGASAALDNAVNALSDAGAFVAVAAGNSNNDACTGSPARATQAYTVGATTLATAGDERASYSSFGTCVNIWAPGSNIEAAWIGSTTATRTISGTSMASPHIAGAGALLFGLGAASVSEVKTLLASYASRGVINLRCTTAACNNSPNLLVFTGCDC